MSLLFSDFLIQIVKSFFYAILPELALPDYKHFPSHIGQCFLIVPITVFVSI